MYVGNHALYARWQKLLCTITFDANGGTCTTSSMSVVPGNAYGTLPTPTRTGYAFAGWFTALSGGDLITETTVAEIYDDQTLFAHWGIKISAANSTTSNKVVIDKSGTYTFSMSQYSDHSAGHECNNAIVSTTRGTLVSKPNYIPDMTIITHTWSGEIYLEAGEMIYLKTSTCSYGYHSLTAIFTLLEE